MRGHLADEVARLKTMPVQRARSVRLPQANGYHLGNAALYRSGVSRMRRHLVQNYNAIRLKGRPVYEDLRSPFGSAERNGFHGCFDGNANALLMDAKAVK